MGEFMHQQPQPWPGARRVLSRTENHVVAHRVGTRGDQRRRIGGLGIGMHPDTCEIVTQELPHAGLQPLGQR